MSNALDAECICIAALLVNQDAIHLFYLHIRGFQVANRSRAEKSH